MQNNSPRGGADVVVDDVVKNAGSWLSAGRADGIAISSRIRLARNLKNMAFPDWAGEDESAKVFARIGDAFKKSGVLAQPLIIDINKLALIDREILKERHLISAELSEGGPGVGLILSEADRVAIMVNEEDHMRMQVIVPGKDLHSAWEKLNSVDTSLERLLDYSFSLTLGYLTACPSNVGTGLRASVMMHLPALKLMSEADQVVKGLDRIGFAVRGLLGEGTDAHGSMFQVSNQITLGDAEEHIIRKLDEIVDEIVQHEKNARARLMEDERPCLFDEVGRAFGVLMNARILPSKEALDLLSSLWLGVECGLVRNLTVSRINELMLLTQPGHLQKMLKKVLESEERDEVRARIVRQKLKNVILAI
ncbi:MAG: protein arginine kinase [Verrucomicrobia bacterium]|nr:protein arginine kinase [Verrucomicrobiota bacterium]